MTFPPTYFLALEFECIRDITNLPFYAGIHWAGFIWNALSQVGLKDPNGTGLRVFPAQNGIRNYTTGDKIGVILSFPEPVKQYVEKLVAVLEKNDGKGLDLKYHDHFGTRSSLHFVKHYCLVGNNPLSWIPLDEKSILQEVESLKEQQNITLIFQTPLRLNRPEGFKTAKHKFFDMDWFSIPQFLAKIAAELDISDYSPETSSLSGSNVILFWIDIPHTSAMGGFLGSIQITGDMAELERFLLTAGQYIGFGKNRSFGLNSYQISGLQRDNCIHTWKTSTNLLNRAISKEQLQFCLSEMKDSSAGEDGLTYKDIAENDSPFISDLQKQINERTYKPGSILSYEVTKDNGDVRLLEVQNLADRLVCKSIASILDDAIDPVLAIGSFAYRKGYGTYKAVKAIKSLYNQGFKYGMKGDIDEFYPSIPRVLLQNLLKGLLRNDPIIECIELFLSQTAKGLSQGMPISPVLSNIFMSCWDHEISRHDWEPIRFGDDFVILSPKSDDKINEVVETSLLKLNLKLNSDKIMQIEPDSEYDYLGFHITPKGYEKIVKVEPDEPDLWKPALNQSEIQGVPVYVSFYQTSVRSEGNDLVIESDKMKRKIPWSHVQRIIIIGRPRVSANVIKTALEGQKPITFMTVTGKTIGGFYPQRSLEQIKDIFPKYDTDFSNYRIQYVRDLVAAKIHNQRTLLKQNQVDEPKLKEWEDSLEGISDIEALRGKEGATAAVYFERFKPLVDPFEFDSRSYHPPQGPVNAMLSFGYTLLYNRIAESLMASGINPDIGLFHERHGAQYALASDVLESFRFLADRAVIAVIRLKLVTASCFENKPASGKTITYMNDEGFREFIHRFEWMLNESITLPDLGQRTYVEIIDGACRNLVTCLKLGLPYKHFRMK